MKIFEYLTQKMFMNIVRDKNKIVEVKYVHRQIHKNF